MAPLRLDVERLRGAVLQRIPASWRRPKVSVGLDLDAASVKAVVLRQHADERTLLTATIQPIPPSTDRAGTLEAIRHVLTTIGFSTLRAPAFTTAVGGAGVVVRFVSLPAMTLAELRQAVQFEADRYLPYPASEVVLDCQPLGPVQDGKQEVLIVAAKTDVVEERLALLREAAVTPQVIDAEAFAVVNAWEATQPADGRTGVTALLEIRAQRAILSVVRQATLRLTREFPTSIEGEPQAEAPTILEHWVKQLQLSFDYFEDQHGQMVDRLLVGGLVQRWPGVVEAFQGALGQRVERWDPVAAFPRSPGLAPDELQGITGELVVALGLGLRGLAG